MKKTQKQASAKGTADLKRQQSAPAAQAQEHKGGLPALSIPKDLTAAFAEDAKENMEHVHDAFHRVSIRGGRYKVGEEVIGNMGVEFEAIILHETPVNVYYKDRYDPDNPVNPDCWGLGGLRPDAAVEDKQNADCVTCKQNRFGTGTDADGKRTRGKACKNTRRLVLKVPGVDLPVIMSLPPMAVKNLNQYLKQLTSNEPPIPMFAVVTRFTFDSAAEFPRPVLSFARMNIEDYAAIRAYRMSQEVVDALNAYASPADFVAETEEQAQEGMEQGGQAQAGMTQGKMKF
jgi:hypothetical protein